VGECQCVFQGLIPHSRIVHVIFGVVMYNVQISNIEGNKLVTSFTSFVESLAEAEIMAIGKCEKITRLSNLALFALEGRVYAVITGNKYVGLVLIRKL